MISKAPTSVVAVIDAGERVAPNEVLGELLKEKELDLRRDLVLFFYFLFFFFGCQCSGKHPESKVENKISCFQNLISLSLNSGHK